MKRWMLLGLVLIVIIASLLLVRLRLAASPVSSNHLFRTPHSAYKYNLCIEAFAFANAQPDNPYKTDYTFHDPFRNANDTIIPRLMNPDKKDNTVTFNVEIIVGQIQTYNDSISHVSALDGISVMLPDKQDQLQRSSVPQFIVGALNGGGQLAVLDFTCPDQWIWKAA
jgi:hypothetical protein